METGLGIAIGGGSVSVATIIFALVQWSLKRNVDTEDRTRLKLEGRVEAVEKSHNELRTDFVMLGGEMRNLLTLVSELKGIVQEMKLTMESGRDKQAAYYRDELSKLQDNLRQDIARSAPPDLSVRVAMLEAEATGRKRGR